MSAAEDEVMNDVHGFHSYPARLHPQTARGLIEGLSQPGARILDPFCGSGTVVLEARALGREGLGSDLNPLAVELAWLKSRGPTKKFADDLVGAALRIAEVAEERRLARAEPYERYDDDTRERYPIHILLELDSIKMGIGELPKNDLSRTLRLVVSSTLTKLAYSEGDTTRRKAPRRLPSGFAIQLFMDKTRELAERLNEYSARLPDKAPKAYVTFADARALSYVDSESVDLVVTSPPYPGVYDYLDHHLHRLRWLGLKESRLSESEIGSRRNYRRRTVAEAAELWQSEMGAVLSELRRVLSRDGKAVIVVADSVIDRQPLFADKELREAAEANGLRVMAIASQERPLFLFGAEQAFRERKRREYVVLLRPERYKPLPKQKPRAGDAPPRRIVSERSSAGKRAKG